MPAKIGAALSAASTKALAAAAASQPALPASMAADRGPAPGDPRTPIKAAAAAAFFPLLSPQWRRRSIRSAQTPLPRGLADSFLADPRNAAGGRKKKRAAGWRPRSLSGHCWWRLFMQFMQFFALLKYSVTRAVSAQSRRQNVAFGSRLQDLSGDIVP